MEQYIALRDIPTGQSEYIKKGALITARTAQDKNLSLIVGFLKIDGDMFLTAFQSNAYMSWLKEFVSDKDENGLPAYPGLARCPETLILYLKDVGVSSSQILNAMYGPGNAYKQYLATAQEFGKTPLE